jgi:ERI1 exoribonuclease 3
MILVDMKDLEIKRSFREYVRPTLNPTLTTFCTSLTGITQETVDAADTFDNVFFRANEWINEVMQEYRTTDIDKFAFVTCGNWDLRHMLPDQCKIMKRNYDQIIPIPRYFNRWINVKDLCKEYFKEPLSGSKRRAMPFGMVGMLNRLGLDLKGRHPSGLDDSINIARIMIELVKRGQSLRYTWLEQEDWEKLMAK